MNQHFSFTNQKTKIASFAAIALLSVTVVAGYSRGANGEFDLTGLERQVQENTNQLNNHEARITNTEKDVNDLQQNTNTAPAQDRVSVPSSTQTTPSTTTAPSSSQTPSGTVAPTPERTFTWLPRQKIAGDTEHCLERKQWSDGQIEETIVDRYVPGGDRCVQ